jgi:hypothetical protein
MNGAAIAAVLALTALVLLTCRAGESIALGRDNQRAGRRVADHA